MTVIASQASGADIPKKYPPRAAVVSWIFFDWAAQPYFTLITTFVFAPYFAHDARSSTCSVSRGCSSRRRWPAGAKVSSR